MVLVTMKNYRTHGTSSIPHIMQISQFLRNTVIDLYYQNPREAQQTVEDIPIFTYECVGGSVRDLLAKRKTI